MKKTLTIFLLLVFIITTAYFLGSCRKKDNGPKNTPVNFNVPQGFPQPLYDFSGNPLTQEGIELGRRLFYEGRLSKDSNFACSSCHQQIASFGTYDHDLSHGYNNSHTLRNAPSLANLAWEKQFHRDGRWSTPELVSQSHISHPGEMGETMASVVEKLKGDPRYQQMFGAAFGEGGINSDRILKALSQFMVTMVSADSRYDRVKKGMASFTAREQQGYSLFQTNCASCHTEPLFTDGTFRNNGLSLNSFLDDKGRMRVTNNPADSVKFKVPSLRNVMVTYPYMHDGRFWGINFALEHYNSGVSQGPTLDPLLGSGIPLSATDKENLVAFLHTLTDSSFLLNPKFSRPPQ